MGHSRRDLSISNISVCDMMECMKLIKVGKMITRRQTALCTAINPYLHLKLNRMAQKTRINLIATSAMLIVTNFSFFLKPESSNLSHQMDERPKNIENIEVAMEMRANFLCESVTISSSSSWWVSSNIRMEAWRKNWQTDSPISS